VDLGLGLVDLDVVDPGMAPGTGTPEPGGLTGRQLLDAGVSSKNISASDLCTVCRNDLLFSYRAEKGKTGRMLALLGLSL